MATEHAPAEPSGRGARDLLLVLGAILLTFPAVLLVLRLRLSTITYDYTDVFIGRIAFTCFALLALVLTIWGVRITNKPIAWFLVGLLMIHLPAYGFLVYWFTGVSAWFAQ